MLRANGPTMAGIGLVLGVLLLAAIPPAHVEFEPPPHASRLCGGHVTGTADADARRFVSITWSAYSSRKPPKALVKDYLKALGPEIHSRSDECDVWRQPADAPESFLEVCGVAKRGRPWNECANLPKGAKSVIMISSMAGR
jgi:hypothetical protein